MSCEAQIPIHYRRAMKMSVWPVNLHRNRSAASFWAIRPIWGIAMATMWTSIKLIRCDSNPIHFPNTICPISIETIRWIKIINIHRSKIIFRLCKPTQETIWQKHHHLPNNIQRHVRIICMRSPCPQCKHRPVVHRAVRRIHPCGMRRKIQYCHHRRPPTVCHRCQRPIICWKTRQYTRINCRWQLLHVPIHPFIAIQI